MGGQAVSLIMLLLLATKLIPFEFAYNHIMDEKMKLTIETICPKVDICNQNVSDPVITPNGKVTPNGLISCCLGCSCHMDCHDELNCCFPENMVTGNVNNETSIPTNEDYLSMEGMSMKNTAPKKQCVFARSGTLTEEWNVFEPAYRIVVKAPPGGCITDRPTEQNFHKLADVPATCDLKSHTPWGDLLPVYSKTQNTIYKNSLCAQCHGVHDYQTWTTLLVCERYNANAGRDISLAEQLDFMQGGNMSKYCHVSFQYNDKSVLLENRCFVDAITTCSGDFRVPEEISLTTSEIRAACQSGLHAPVLGRDTVYRNAFCEMCNNEVISNCFPDNVIGKGYNQRVIYILDTSDTVSDNKARVEGQCVSHQKACLYVKDELDQTSCRPVYCPSGQIRKANGQCEILIKQWNMRLFLVRIKLEYAYRNGYSILKMFTSGLVSREIISESFIKSNPWPDNFKMVALYLEKRSVYSNHSMSVDMKIHTAAFEAVVTTVRKFMKRRWNVVLDGNEMSFTQSLMVIHLTPMSTDHAFLYVPYWKPFSRDMDTRIDMPTFASMNWTIIFKDMSLIFETPYEITKAVMCNLVSLFDDEYKLFADKTVLVSNLTNRVLFNTEYELVEDQYGIIVSRVCVQDTRFKIDLGTNYAFTRSASTLPLITLVFQLICTRIEF